jgi:hypothetical protein
MVKTTKDPNPGFFDGGDGFRPYLEALRMTAGF